MHIRLRQVAMVGDDYDGVEAQLAEGFGLGVAYRDPGDRPGREAGVSPFGLRNFVMPIGDQFLELVTPQPDAGSTAGGRYIERRGGPGGYMLIFQVPRDDFPGYVDRVKEMGIRIVAGDGIVDETTGAIHLHPKDLPGCITEIRWCENEDVSDGDWWPVEKTWREYKNTEVIEGISGAEIQTDDPAPLAQRWAEVLGLEVIESGGAPAIQVDEAVVRFVECADGRPEGLGAIDVSSRDVATAAERVGAAGAEVDGATAVINGLRMHLTTLGDEA